MDTSVTAGIVSAVVSIDEVVLAVSKELVGSEVVWNSYSVTADSGLGEQDVKTSMALITIPRIKNVGFFILVPPFVVYTHMRQLLSLNDNGSQKKKRDGGDHLFSLNYASIDLM
jgi:hypothetical protein